MYNQKSKSTLSSYFSYFLDAAYLQVSMLQNLNFIRHWEKRK